MAAMAVTPELIKLVGHLLGVTKTFLGVGNSKLPNGVRYQDSEFEQRLLHVFNHGFHNNKKKDMSHMTHTLFLILAACRHAS